MEPEAKFESGAFMDVSRILSITESEWERSEHFLSLLIALLKNEGEWKRSTSNRISQSQLQFNSNLQSTDLEQINMAS